ncbi:MAG: dihydrofolate reductase [Pusillimonas sp.]|jgi:dihydrofolate reductase|nr:dihydrofolate reductase [Pusillimonas sp.]
MNSPRPHIKCVVAYAKNRVIGRNNTLPWRLPSDLAHFKKVTMGQPIIMGRKTWESLGRPLPGRRNIVVSRNASYNAPGAEVFSSVKQALEACNNEPSVCIIGGAQIFNDALPFVDEIIATEIMAEIDGDVFFPELQSAQWQETGRLDRVEENGYEYEIATYQSVNEA